MPPRTTPILRPQSIRLLSLRPATVARPLHRSFASKDPPPPPEQPVGPNQDVLPSISEETAATAKITGETPPEIEQGTPVSEVIKRDPSAQKTAPSVLKDQITPGSKRQYSTAAEPPVPFDAVEVGPGIPVGAKFPLPTMPLPPNSHLHKRYSPVLEQVTNHIMQDGKKATAQSVMNEVLSILRTKGPPKVNPRTPIIPSAPPLESLPSDPLAYLQTAVDSVSPLVQIKSQKAAGGFREQVPSPLALRQRRRKAIGWIIEAADKKRARMPLAERIADEIVAVVEGRSSAWEKRQMVHRTGVAGRAYVRK